MTDDFMTGKITKENAFDISRDILDATNLIEFTNPRNNLGLIKDPDVQLYARRTSKRISELGQLIWNKRQAFIDEGFTVKGFSNIEDMRQLYSELKVASDKLDEIQSSLEVK